MKYDNIQLIFNLYYCCNSIPNFRFDEKKQQIPMCILCRQPPHVQCHDAPEDTSVRPAFIKNLTHLSSACCKHHSCVPLPLITPQILRPRVGEEMAGFIALTPPTSYGPRSLKTIRCFFFYNFLLFVIFSPTLIFLPVKLDCIHS